jgi:hypothetical protein
LPLLDRSIRTQTTMTEEVQGRQQRRSKLWIPALALTILVAIIVIPPLVGINRYKGRIARAISNSLGRPVHLSGVELRLLPRPGFVITDLTVEEDPAYGVEPVLHASEVKASLRLLSFWRGKLEISRISVDDASLNLVRTIDGRWNLDTLFRSAAQTQAGESKPRRQPWPYLEATNSRINIKRGVEKLPYSLVNADLSFWEENPGEWRVRLKGQPARTDVALDLGDTGIVQLEGSVQRNREAHPAGADDLHRMPIHVELEWRDAQLGQLSRLLIGSDPGWRGDLRAEMKLDGNAESAQVVARLRASGVHREEFAPAVPLDFDANCGFVYHYSARSIDKLACNSPLGDGRLLIEGNLPSDGEPKLSVAVQKIPAQAVLDALRTVRSEVGAGVEAAGTLSGNLSYDATIPLAPVEPVAKPTHRGTKTAKLAAAQPGPLTGNITLEGLRLSGGSLSQPIQIQKAVLQPALSADGKTELLSGTAGVPAGATEPLALTARLTQGGYELSIKGEGTPARLKQLAQAAGLKEAGALDSVAGDPVTLDLAIGGPWLPPPEVLLAESAGTSGEPVEGNPSAASGQPVQDRLNGTVTLHNANWKTDVLATAVQIPQAVLHLNGGARTWDPVEFVYGPLKGTARLVIPVCDPEQQCLPTLTLDVPTLDVADLQAALLGSPKKGSLLSTVIERLNPSSSQKWPAFQGMLKAESLVLGPVTFDGVTADVKVMPVLAEVTSLEAGLLGGRLHLTGKIENGDKPAYSLEGQLQQVNPAELCEVLEVRCNGTRFDGDGKIEFAGYTGKDLGLSAKGTLHFDWKKGAVLGRMDEAGDAIPAMLARFDDWTGDTAIASGAMTLGDNKVRLGKRNATAKWTITFGEPPKVSFGTSKSAGTTKK